MTDRGRRTEELTLTNAKSIDGGSTGATAASVSALGAFVSTARAARSLLPPVCCRGMWTERHCCFSVLLLQEGAGWGEEVPRRLMN
jgi:hypothetical protein